MAVLKIRRGLEANRAAFTPEDGEILCASDTKVLYLGDGSTAGGIIVRADAITFNGQPPSAFATAAQGNKADTAYGWGDHSLAGYQLASDIPDSLSDFINDVGFITDYTVTQADVVAHQAALTLTKSQISDLETYEPGDIEGLQEALDEKLDLAGGTMTGSLNLAASSTGGAGLNLGEGVAPSAPVNGDMWVTTTNIQVRVNGTTRTLAYTNSWSTVSQAEAEAGTSTSTRLWTAQRVRQAITALSPVKGDGTGASGTWGISITGNAGSADVLSTARNIALSGDVTGSASFDGSGNISITATVVDNSHAHTIANVTGLQAALDDKQPLSSVLTNTTASFTSALATKLSGIEAGADVTDAANVEAAGALMDSDFSTNGIMLRTGAGAYSTVANNSSNWNTAYGWGNHASAGYGVLASNQTWTGHQTFVETSETEYTLSGTTPSIDPANGGIQIWTLTGNSTPTYNLTDGQAVTLKILDGADYTIDWGAAEFLNGEAPELDTTDYTLVEVAMLDGTLMVAQIGTLAV